MVVASNITGDTGNVLVSAGTRLTASSPRYSGSPRTWRAEWCWSMPTCHEVVTPSTSERREKT